MSHCKRCHKKPEEILEYKLMANTEELTPDEAVRLREGTFDPETETFLCTDCYIKSGMPLN